MQTPILNVKRESKILESTLFNIPNTITSCCIQEQSQKVLEYLLSKHFVDKIICNSDGEYLSHCIRGAEELFSIIERNVPHHLLLNNSQKRVDPVFVENRNT